MRSMPPVIDLHEDLLPHVEARGVYGEEWQTSLTQLEQSPVRVVVASTWPGGLVGDTVSARALAADERFMREYAAVAETSAEWDLVLTADDLGRALEGGARGLLVHVEGVPNLEDSVEQALERWFGLGCRSVGLMWNEANGFGFGPDHPDDGLSERGRRAVRWLDRNPLVLDTAHMGEATFWETLDATSGLLIASHTAARALWDNPRNLTDDQLRAIAERGGVIGVGFAELFVGDGGASGAARVVDHIEHIASVAGENRVAVGSDFGGVNEGVLPDLGSVDRLGALFDELSSRGFSRAQLEAIASGNAARALRLSLSKSP